jgi:hypothetical protein
MCKKSDGGEARVLQEAGLQTVAYPGILLGVGGSTNSVEDRENGDLGVVAS